MQANETTGPTVVPPQVLADDAHPITHPLAMVLDLCLYRLVTDRCGGRVLPYGVRHMIKGYAWSSFDNKTLRTAVRFWCRDRAKALKRYGEINDWDVSRVTNMASLFLQTKFNDRIDRWDVRRVTTMDNMFDFASDFNQSLETWNVSK
eukprot:gene17848-20647_t